MSNSHTIIAIEGIDGAGKSTVVEYIQKIMGNDVAIYHRTNKGIISKRLLSFGFVKKHVNLQIPIYLLISLKNYMRTKRSLYSKDIIVMDRCFLSNICYFYPSAIYKTTILKFIMLFEVKLVPNKIFIIDESPKIAHMRDGGEKDLKWLIQTRNHYLESANSALFKKYNIEIIDSKCTIEERVNTIINYLGVQKNGNR